MESDDGKKEGVDTSCFDELSGEREQQIQNGIASCVR